MREPGDEKLAHDTFLLALRTMYEAHNLDVDIRTDPAWAVLREIAAGKLTLTRTPGEFLPPGASAEVHEISLEEVHKIQREQRRIAQMILAENERFLSDDPPSQG